MVNVILVIILAGIIGGAALYIYRAKKRGQACIGCPHAKTCASRKCNCDNSTSRL